MKVLVGCEESGVVTKAFRDRGHEAYSCDLLPTRGNPDWHIQDDIIITIKVNMLTPAKNYDLIILHPSCDHLAVCGNKHYAKGKPEHYKRINAISWTMDLWALATKCSKKVVLENPASVIFPHLRRAGAIIQYVQPYEFGHMEQKKTGLALHGVKPLKETNNVREEMMKLPKNKREKIFFMAPSPTRKRDRSITYQGIADAMVDQWGR
jgi:hypothetical protein